MWLKISIRFLVGLIISIFYPKLIKESNNKLRIYFFSILFILRLVIFSLERVIFLLFSYILIFIFARKLEYKEIKDWKVTISLVIMLVMFLLAINNITRFRLSVFIGILLLESYWISKDNSSSNYINAINILFLGNLFLKLIILFIGTL